MDYNTSRTHLILPEYGRYIQKMVMEMKTIQEKDKRSALAAKIIKLMALLGPTQKENDESKQRLWDHLYTLSGYDLDIDSPFTMEKPVPIHKLEEKPKYSQSKIKIRSYGKYITDMLANAVNQPSSLGRDTYINNIASFMKMMHRQWQDDKVPDAMICQNIASLTGGKIIIDSFTDVHNHSDQKLLNVAKKPNENGNSINQPRMMGNKTKKNKKRSSGQRY